MNKEEARKRIRGQVHGLPFTRNVIRLVLVSLAKEEGTDTVNSLIDEFDLEKKGWRKV